jgi:hypothetical protein
VRLRQVCSSHRAYISQACVLDRREALIGFQILRKKIWDFGKSSLYPTVRHSMLTNDRIPGEMISITLTFPHHYGILPFRCLVHCLVIITCFSLIHPQRSKSNPTMTRFWDLFSQFYPPKPKFTELDVPDLRDKVNSCFSFCVQN